MKISSLKRESLYHIKNYYQRKYTNKQYNKYMLQKMPNISRNHVQNIVAYYSKILLIFVNVNKEMYVLFK